MAKIREELEIVSSDDLNALLDRIKKVANEVKNVNNTPIKPETDSSEIDETSKKLSDLRKNAEKGVGYNAYTGEWVNMMDAGVIDPAKVTRSALQNAASVAGMLLTTECAITDIPEPPAPQAPAPDMGGMY